MRVAPSAQDAGTHCPAMTLAAERSYQNPAPNHSRVISTNGSSPVSTTHSFEALGDRSASLRGPGRRSVALIGIAFATAACVLGMFVLPPRLAGATDAQREHLSTTTSDALLAYWHSGERGFPPQLQSLLDYWVRFHVVKAGLSLVTAVLAVWLTTQLWTRFARAERPRWAGRIVCVGGAVAATAVSGFAILAMMANIQGALAPLSSLLSVPSFGTGERLHSPGAKIARQLDPYAPATASPTLRRMVDDFAYYHQILAVVAGVLALTAVAAAAMLVVRLRARPSTRAVKLILRSYLAVLILTALAGGILCFANITVAHDAAHALLTLVRGEPSL